MATNGATPMRFEVVTLPVSDVDRAKDFYQRLGWRMDIDFMPDPDSPESTQQAAARVAEATEGEPVKKGLGVDVTPP